jgi:hypothetical protein
VQLLQILVKHRKHIGGTVDEHDAQFDGHTLQVPLNIVDSGLHCKHMDTLVYKHDAHKSWVHLKQTPSAVGINDSGARH